MMGQELSDRIHVDGVVGPTFGDKKVVLIESNEGSNTSDDGKLSKKDDGSGEVKVTDLVWGKVKSHPWWPGMVFDPSASTNKAMKYFKKDGLLIAYFGDQSFAWNETCNVKPFRVSFGEMAGQSDGESFCRGVDCALHEVARRAEVGLACMCVSEEAWSKIKSCVVVNPGIKKGFSRIDCGDRFSTVESFEPEKVVDSVRDLATNPFGVNRLDVSTVGGQLTAFNRWKGNHQLQISDVLDGESFKPEKVVDSVRDLATNLFGVNRLDASTVAGQLAAFNRWKGNRQLQISDVLDESDDKFEDDGSVVKKGKSNACVKVSKKRKHLFNGDLSPSKKVKCLSDLMSNESDDKFEDDGSVVKKGKSNACVKVSKKRKHLFNGDLSPSKKVKCLSDLMSNESDEEYKPKRRGRKRKAVEPNRSSEEIQSSNEFLSQMRLAAINPIQRQRNLDSLVKFANEFRSYRVKEEKNDVDQMEEIVTDGFRGIKDSYWPDRIIVTKSVSPKPKKEDLPTALTFKFSNLDSVPSLKKMNEIFSRYGPLKEEETRLLKRKNCMKVVYERRSDAETAFSSSGKFSIFGPALVSYCLEFKPTLRKSAVASKKKGVKSGKALKVED